MPRRPAFFPPALQLIARDDDVAACLTGHQGRMHNNAGREAPAGHPADHLVPFQRSATPSLFAPFGCPKPTAQHLADDVQCTAWSWLTSMWDVPPGSGAGTSRHTLPFQCMAWFRAKPVLGSRGVYHPT